MSFVDVGGDDVRGAYDPWMLRDHASRDVRLGWGVNYGAEAEAEVGVEDANPSPARQPLPSDLPSNNYLLSLLKTMPLKPIPVLRSLPLTPSEPVHTIINPTSSLSHAVHLPFPDNHVIPPNKIPDTVTRQENNTNTE